MKLIVQAIRVLPPESSLILTPRLREATRLLKEEGWRVSFYSEVTGAYPEPTPEEAGSPITMLPRTARARENDPRLKPGQQYRKE